LAGKEGGIGEEEEKTKKGAGIWGEKGTTSDKKGGRERHLKRQGGNDVESRYGEKGRG